MKMGEVYNPFRRSEFEARIKQWLKQYITERLSFETVVLAVAPGHEMYNVTSFMYNLVGEFILENRELNIEDGRSLLVRYKTIEKQAYAGVNRSEITHLASIRIHIDGEYEEEDEEDIIAQLNEGKVVIILDDVWTSGCTLRACEMKVHSTNPRGVHLLAIGKTV